MSIGKIDRKRFYAALAAILRVRSWSQQQVAGLDRLFDGFENDRLVPAGPIGIQRVAYWIYTDWLETAHTFTPIKELGGPAYYIRRYGAKTAKGRELGNDSDAEAVAYAGKGDVQLTGESNYEAAEEMIRRNYPELVAQWEAANGRTWDLTIGDQPNDEHDVDNALVPEFSYAILVAGTTEGLFGPPLNRYINATGARYGPARHSVNGTDRAGEFTQFCPKIEAALIASLVDDPAPPAIAPKAAQGAVAGTVVQIPAVAADTATVAVEGVTSPETPAVRAPEAVVGGGPTDDAVQAAPPIWQRVWKWALGSSLSIGGLGAAGLGAFQALGTMDRIVQIIFAITFVIILGFVILAAILMLGYFLVNQLFVKKWRASPNHYNVS